MTLLREWKDKLQLGEIFEIQVPHKESVSKIQKEPSEFNSTKPMRKWAKKKKTWIDISSDTVQTANKQMNSPSAMRDANWNHCDLSSHTCQNS